MAIDNVKKSWQFYESLHLTVNGSYGGGTV
jgi:hypothetical protein